MAYTRITPATVTDTRRGFKQQPKPLFTPGRYRVTEERTSYRDGQRRVETDFWYEDRVSVFMSEETVEARYTIVKLPDGSTIEIETPFSTLWQGDPVHVAVHRIMGRQFTDLFDDKRQDWLTHIYYRFPEHGKTLPVLVGISIAGALIWSGHERWHALGIGCYCAVGFFVFLHARRLYGDHRLPMMRWFAKRKIKKALQDGRPIGEQSSFL